MSYPQMIWIGSGWVGLLTVRLLNRGGIDLPFGIFIFLAGAILGPLLPIIWLLDVYRQSRH